MLRLDLDAAAEVLRHIRLNKLLPRVRHVLLRPSPKNIHTADIILLEHDVEQVRVVHAARQREAAFQVMIDLP